MNENDNLPSPNRVVHEPARLAILVVLSSCASADFLFLQNATGLSKGNLSVQLTNLEENGLLVVTKKIEDRKTRTIVRLSKRGATEIEEYWKTMDTIRARMSTENGNSHSSSRSTSRAGRPLKVALR